MTTLVSEDTKNIHPYKLASHKIWEKKLPASFLKLDWNEAVIPAPSHVIEAIQNFIKTDKINLYPDVCNAELVELIAAYVNLPKECVQYFSSSDSAHEYLAQAFLNANDVVINVTPTYDNFRIPCQAKGAKIVSHVLNDNFDLDWIELQNSITEHKPKLVYICNPNNPTGTLHDIQSIVSLVDQNRQTVFLVDEAYYEFAGTSVSKFVMEYKNIIVTRTFSKAFALANLRLGYMLSHPSNIVEINKIRNPKNISSISQVAAIAALRDFSYMTSYVEEVLVAKQQFQNALQKFSDNMRSQVGGFGNFTMVHFEDELERGYFTGGLAHQNIFVRDLSHIKELRNSVRITIGTIQQMDHVLSVTDKLYANGRNCTV
jgi:histidinol-phosphate aminotransferase